MNLIFRENYWDNPDLKRKYIDFLILIHKLDLTLWDKMGFWDQRYRPFSYFEGESLVSNVSVYSMDMTIRGKRCLVAQISGVGTLPEYRKRGLSFKLTQIAMDWARNNHDFFFLFADQEAYHLYKKCGFGLVDEYKTRISVSGQVARSGAVKLDIQRKDHIEQIYQIASDRSPVSDILGVSNKRLFMFWCLYFLKDYIYYIPELDLLVLYKRDSGMITIFDIVCRNIPSFSEIYAYICDKHDQSAEFLFMIDKLNLGSCDQIRIDENGTHILGNCPLEGTKFIFPLTAHA